MPRSGLHDRKAAVGILVVALVYLATFFFQARKNPLVGDEVDFFMCIENQREHARPVYYAGEYDYDPSELVQVGSDELGARRLAIYEFAPSLHVIKGNHFAMDGSSRYTYCLWHPPLYVTLTAQLTRLYPVARADAWLLRFYNLPLIAVLTAALAWVAGILYPRRSTAVVAIGLAILVLCPLWLRGTSLIDYAAALAPTCAVLLVGGWLRARDRFSVSTLACFALPWFCSFGVAVAMSLTVLLASGLTGGFRAVVRTSLQLLAGFAAFSCAFFVWSKIGHFSFSEPYLYNFLFHGGSQGGIKPLRSVQHLWRYTQEIGIVLVSAFAVLTFAHCRRPSGLTDPRTILPLAVLVAFGFHAGLRVDAWGFPKYIVYALPLLALFVAGEALELIQQESGRVARVALVLLGLVGLHGSVGIIRTLADPYPNLYLKGQQGLLAVASALREGTRPDETIIAAKDLAFYAGRKSIVWYGRARSDPGYLEREVALHGPRAFAAPVNIASGATKEVTARIERWFPEERRLGSFEMRKAAK